MSRRIAALASTRLRDLKRAQIAICGNYLPAPDVDGRLVTNRA